MDMVDLFNGTATGGLTISSDDEGPAVGLATWQCFTIMAFCVVTKVSTKILRGSTSMRREWIALDDIFITLAMFFMLGESIAVSNAVFDGMGQPTSTLDDDQITKFEKSYYSAGILYVITLGLAQQSILAFTRTIAKGKIINTVVHATMGFSAAWTFASIFAVAFECPASNGAWQVLNPQCKSAASTWIGIGIVEMLVEIACVALPVCVLATLETTWSKKTAPIIILALRLLILPVLITRLVYINNPVMPGDLIYSSWVPQVITQVQLAVAIIASCAPFLRNTIDQLQPGYFSADTRTGLGFMSYQTSKASYNTSGFAPGSVTKLSTQHSDLEMDPLASSTEPFSGIRVQHSVDIENEDVPFSV